MYVTMSPTDDTVTFKRQSDNLEIIVKIENKSFEKEIERIATESNDSVASGKPPPIWEADIREDGRFLSMKMVRA